MKVALEHVRVAALEKRHAGPEHPYAWCLAATEVCLLSMTECGDEAICLLRIVSGVVQETVVDLERRAAAEESQRSQPTPGPTPQGSG